MLGWWCLLLFAGCWGFSWQEKGFLEKAVVKVRASTILHGGPESGGILPVELQDVVQLLNDRINRCALRRFSQGTQQCQCLTVDKIHRKLNITETTVLNGTHLADLAVYALYYALNPSAVCLEDESVCKDGECALNFIQVSLEENFDTTNSTIVARLQRLLQEVKKVYTPDNKTKCFDVNDVLHDVGFKNKSSIDINQQVISEISVALLLRILEGECILAYKSDEAMVHIFTKYGDSGNMRISSAGFDKLLVDLKFYDSKVGCSEESGHSHNTTTNATDTHGHDHDHDHHSDHDHDHNHDHDIHDHHDHGPSEHDHTNHEHEHVNNNSTTGNITHDHDHAHDHDNDHHIHEDKSNSTTERNIHDHDHGHDHGHAHDHDHDNDHHIHEDKSNSTTERNIHDHDHGHDHVHDHDVPKNSTTKSNIHDHDHGHDHNHDDHNHEHDENETSEASYATKVSTEETIALEETNASTKQLPNITEHEHDTIVEHAQALRSSETEHDHGHEHDHEHDHGHDHGHEHGHEHAEEVHEKECAVASRLLREADVDGSDDLDADEFLQLCPSLLREVAEHDKLIMEKNKTQKKVNNAEVYGYGTFSVFIISLCSVFGILLVPCLSTRVYEYFMMGFVALGFGSMTGDAVLHLTPQFLGLHNHNHEDGDDHDHDHEQIPQYFLTSLAVLAAIYGFYLFESCANIIGKRMKNRISPNESTALNGHGHSHNNAEILAALKKDSFNKLPAKTISRETLTLESRVESAADLEMQPVSNFQDSPKVCCGLKPVALMVILGDAVHNVADGLAIGAAFAISTRGGISTSIAIFCHEFPHELGDFALLLSTGLSKKSALAWNFVSSLSAFIGLYAGVAIGLNPDAAQWILAVTAGMFLYIALGDMLPEMKSCPSSSPWLMLFAQNLGMLCGFAAMAVIAIYEDKIQI